MDESRLIQQALQGDVQAFNGLVLEYQDRVYTVAYRIMGEQDSAADATQDAFIAAFKKLHTFRGDSFKSWLLRIVTNTCYDELRRRKRRPADSLEDLMPDSADDPPQLVSEAENPEDYTERAELSRAIEGCIRGLSPEHRALVVLRDVEDLDYQEIADTTGLGLGTVKSRLSRARARLRDCLSKFGELLPAQYRLKNS